MNLSSLERPIYSLDIVLPIAGLLVTLVLILQSFVIGNPHYAAVGIILLLSCMAYLFIRKGTELPEISESPRSYQLYLLFNIIFFSALLFSILSLYLRPEPYIRPPSYFISMVIMAGALAAAVLFLPRRKPYSYLLLTQIILIPLSLTWSQLLIFPTLIGDDPWWHQWFTQSILDLGLISGSAGYARLPVLHLVSGTTVLVTGLDYKMAALFSISSMNIIGVLLFTFLLGRFIFNDNVGLLAALILGVSVDFLGMSYLIMPNTFAAFMIVVIIYMLFKIKTKKSLLATQLTILFMAILILTHPIASMCLAMLLFALWAGFEVFNRVYNQRKTPVTFGIAAIFFLAMFGWWMYASEHLLIIAEVMGWGFSLDYWTPFAPASEAVAVYNYQMPVFESLFNSLNRYLLIGISLPGCFYMLSKKISHPYAFSLSAGATAITALILIVSVFGIEILTGRWHYFVQVVISVPLAVTLIIFSARIKTAVGKISIIIVITAIITLLTILTPTANLGNPLFRNALVRKAYTESELRATETLLEITERNIATDRGPIRHFVYLPQFPSERLSFLGASLWSKDFTYFRDSTIMIRREISQGSINLGVESYTRLNYDPAQLLDDEGFSRVYECGSVSAFYWNSNKLPIQEGP